jgi:DNA polymerase III epsilon subunit-like protein
MQIMIDLETLGTKPGCVITTLAAVLFEPDSGKILKEFCANIDLKSSMNAGLVTEPDTVKWWLTQKPEILKLMFEDTEDLEKVLKDFSKWFNKWRSGEALTVWGNSSTFDLSILDAAYRKVDIKTPWVYKEERCYRTITNELWHFVGKEWPEQPKNAHDPIVDLNYQVNILTEIHAALFKAKAAMKSPTIKIKSNANRKRKK